MRLSYPLAEDTCRSIDMISDKKIAQIRKKQRDFLDALVEFTQLWTKPLDIDGALEAGRRVGLEDVLVGEFLVYWANDGEIDKSYVKLADDIRNRLQNQGAPRHTQRKQRFDIFISHASEDKDAIARPLYNELVRRGISVWFDEATLKLGDSLRRKIDEGLAGCRYGIVILSPRFLAKEWPQRELDGLTARETAKGEKAILPVWHELGKEELLAFSTTLADKLGVTTDQPLAVIVDRIMDVLES